MSLIKVREPGTNWHLFSYDPETERVEIQRRGKKTTIDLKALKDSAQQALQPPSTPRATGPPG